MSVVYDDIPPERSIKYPAPKSAVNNLNVAYHISESLSSGQFVYTQIGGNLIQIPRLLLTLPAMN